MKHKIPDILFMGFVCMFFFIAIGGIWGFIVNWIIFGWLAYEQNVRYTYSPLGVRDNLLGGYWKKYIDEQVNNGTINFQETGLTHFDWEVIWAVDAIKYYIDNEYRGYKNISNKGLALVSKVNEMLTGNVATTPDSNASYCAKYINGQPYLYIRKNDMENNQIKDVMVVTLNIKDTKVVPWYVEWCKTHTVR